MTNKTITESGFREFLAAYDECDDVHEPSLREAFKKIGFPIVPDPIREPVSVLPCMCGYYESEKK